MLPLANRLKKKKDIERVLAARLSSRSGPLVCKTALSDIEVARFCFVVSKKISNNAVVRNRLKRQMRHVVAGLLPRVKKGYDCVFIACPGLENKKFEELALIVERALKNVRVLV